MDKLKNMFVGCPVLVKGLEDEGPRIIVYIDADEKTICVLHLKSQFHAWYTPKELRLLSFAEPEKVRDHLERFSPKEPEPETKVGGRFRVKGNTICPHYFSIGEEVELIKIEEDELHKYKSPLSGKTQYVNLQDLESI